MTAQRQGNDGTDAMVEVWGLGTGSCSEYSGMAWSEPRKDPTESLDVGAALCVAATSCRAAIQWAPVALTLRAAATPCVVARSQADINHKIDEGAGYRVSALDIAKRCNHAQVVSLLEAAMSQWQEPAPARVGRARAPVRAPQRARRWGGTAFVAPSQDPQVG